MKSASGDDDTAWVKVEELPLYLQQAISDSTTETPGPGRVRVLDLEEIGKLKGKEEQWTGLLVLRHFVTQAMKGGDGRLLRPELILKRAHCHEALGYDELAVGDAYAAHTLASGESEDLVGRTVAVAVSADGAEEKEEEEEEEWDVDGRVAAEVRVGSVRVLVRGLHRLGAVGEAERWEGVLRRETEGKEQEGEGEGDAGWWVMDSKIDDDEDDDDRQGGLEGIYGRCQRVVYPWNSHEPARMSAASLAEINERLRQASDGMLECRKTVLPSLSTTSTENAQLGLFAIRRLGPSTAVLRERSGLTAIRPHEAALCDCCAADLESVGGTGGPVECPGCRTTLFCSRECRDLAGRSYHRPNLGGGDEEGEEEEGEGEYAPASTPFCGGTGGSETPFTDLGRAESSTTPEWDLYFLLVVRCIQMAITQDVHPLDLFEVKYLWGGFSSSSNTGSSDNNNKKQKKKKKKKKKQHSLPFSFHHHISLPFQLFESLLLSVPGVQPYSGVWLDRFDFWTVNTLYAKFRGVATASQSSFDGAAETAAVHALWCLANHSCAPNVGWAAGGGVRVLRVREGEDEEEKGIEEGGEVWNHYTDVREADVRVRRARLREVLGGECMCGRCVREAKEEEEEEEGEEEEINK